MGTSKYFSWFEETISVMKRIIRNTQFGMRQRDTHRPCSLSLSLSLATLEALSALVQASVAYETDTNPGGRVERARRLSSESPARRLRRAHARLGLPTRLRASRQRLERNVPLTRNMMVRWVHPIHRPARRRAIQPSSWPLPSNTRRASVLVPLLFS